MTIKETEKKAIKEVSVGMRNLILNSTAMKEKREFDEFVRDLCSDILRDANVDDDGGCPLCQG